MAYKYSVQRARRERIIAQGLCTNCMKSNDRINRTHCTKCAKKDAARWQEHKKAGHCSRCLKPSDQPTKTYCSSCEPDHKERNLLSQRRNRNILREAAFDHYGHICVCCSEGEKRFLCFDHIDDDGHLLYNSTDGLRGSLPRWLQRENYPKNIQVLCYNCNNAKRYGTCPHKSK